MPRKKTAMRKADSCSSATPPVVAPQTRYCSSSVESEPPSRFFRIRSYARMASGRVSPVEAILPDDFRDLDLVVLVPAFAAHPLGLEMADVFRPLPQRVGVLPPDERQALAVLGREGLDLDEPGRGARELFHLPGHFVVILAGLGRQLRTERDEEHPVCIPGCRPPRNCLSHC